MCCDPVDGSRLSWPAVCPLHKLHSTTSELGPLEGVYSSWGSCNLVLRGFKISKKIGRTVGLDMTELPYWGRVSARFPGEEGCTRERCPMAKGAPGLDLGALLTRSYMWKTKNVIAKPDDPFQRETP